MHAVRSCKQIRKRSLRSTQGQPLWRKSTNNERVLIHGTGSGLCSAERTGCSVRSKLNIFFLPGEEIQGRISWSHSDTVLRYLQLALWVSSFLTPGETFKYPDKVPVVFKIFKTPSLSYPSHFPHTCRNSGSEVWKVTFLNPIRQEMKSEALSLWVIFSMATPDFTFNNLVEMAGSRKFGHFVFIRQIFVYVSRFR